MRWFIYLIVLLIISLLQMLLGSKLPAPNIHGEYLLLLAFYIALVCPAGSIIAVFFMAGLFRDVFLGSHLGLSTLSFTLSAILVVSVRNKICGEHIYTRFFLLFIMLLANLLVFSFWGAHNTGWQVMKEVSYCALYSLLLGPTVKLLLDFLPIIQATEKHRSLV